MSRLRSGTATTCIALFCASIAGAAPDGVGDTGSTGGNGGSAPEPTCGTWRTTDLLAEDLTDLSTTFLDSGLPQLWSYRTVSSQFPCSVAAAIPGRERWFRSGSHEPPLSNHPRALQNWNSTAWRSLARVQAGDGTNPDAVANVNDFLVHANTDVGSASRMWSAYGYYAPPSAPSTAGGGQRLILVADLYVRSSIVLDNRPPSCPDVVDGCATGESTTHATIEFLNINPTDALDPDSRRVIEDVTQRSVLSKVEGSNFCTSSVTGSAGGTITLKFPRMEVGVGGSTAWTVGGNRYDSGWKVAPLKLRATVCKSESPEAYMVAMRCHSDGLVIAGIGGGTWSETRGECKIQRLAIDHAAGCATCRPTEAAPPQIEPH